MSSASEKELLRRNEDLEKAIRVVGEIAADVAVTPKQRLDQIAGIVRMHATPKAG